ncbi:flavodoxin family protein [Pendulispora brunnea]|uniref:Flavodoxin family protein n=1 Tax=Pendulispora brunnea TaxID=2905690 RepID=A0ABZ2K0S3_9BACT
MTEIRKGQAPPKLERAEFRRRFRAKFADPEFEAARSSIDTLEEIAWRAYRGSRKSPRTRVAGPGYADPTYELSVDWLEAKARIEAAAEKHRDPKSASRVLVICGASRNDGTCPSEVSKTWRLVKAVEAKIAAESDFEVDVLDLSLLASEYGRTIHPCKACVSTAMPLCHWPCSCYPNYGLGQVGDWMNEIYERWTRAHGVLLVTPVYWYQVPSGLKSMLDRLVCADGGNPDPTLTGGKDPKKAKAVELDGWDYPQHLAGRVFGVVVHGDVAGTENVRRALSDWLTWMGLVEAGKHATLDRYIGYYEPYATSHDALDRDTALMLEVENAAMTVAAAVRLLRAGKIERPGASLRRPRPK